MGGSNGHNNNDNNSSGSESQQSPQHYEQEPLQKPMEQTIQNSQDNDLSSKCMDYSKMFSEWKHTSPLLSLIHLFILYTPRQS